jgi:hypothetical protein
VQATSWRLEGQPVYALQFADALVGSADIHSRHRHATSGPSAMIGEEALRRRWAESSADLVDEAAGHSALDLGGNQQEPIHEKAITSRSTPPSKLFLPSNGILRFSQPTSWLYL